MNTKKSRRDDRIIEVKKIREKKIID